MYSILSTIPRVVSNIHYLSMIPRVDANILTIVSSIYCLSLISWQVNLYNDTYGFLAKTIFVGDCWSVMGNRSLDVCDVQGE